MRQREKKRLLKMECPISKDAGPVHENTSYDNIQTGQSAVLGNSIVEISCQENKKEPSEGATERKELNKNYINVLSTEIFDCLNSIAMKLK